MAKVTITLEDQPNEVSVHMESTPPFTDELTYAQSIALKALHAMTIEEEVLSVVAKQNGMPQ